MPSSDLIAALEEERQRLLKAREESNNNAAAITAAYRSAIAQKHAIYSEKSRRYSRWVERQARNMKTRLDKKGKQMDRNQEKMGRTTKVLLAETESLNAKLAKFEADQVIENTRSSDRLEEIEQEIMANKLNMDERSIRSRAPSPEPFSAAADTNIATRAKLPTIFAPVEEDISCKTETHPGSRQPCTNLLQTSTLKSTDNICAKPPFRKIIWKIKRSSISDSSSTIPPPNPVPPKEKKKEKKIEASNRYTWEEYYHSEVFEEPDNPYDEDYEPSIED